MYGDKFAPLMRCTIEASGAGGCTVHVIYAVWFSKAMSKLLRPMVQKGVEGGRQQQQRPCPALRFARRPAGPQHPLLLGLALARARAGLSGCRTRPQPASGAASPRTARSSPPSTPRRTTGRARRRLRLLRASTPRPRRSRPRRRRPLLPGAPPGWPRRAVPAPRWPEPL
jgi:hypothetical protein